MFHDVLNKYLQHYGSSMVEGIMYEQFTIAEKNSTYYIFENNKIINHAKTLKEAKQLIDSINSGC